MHLVYASIFSFELTLLSVEQSLKLLLLLRFGKDIEITHKLQKLYSDIQSQGKRGAKAVEEVIAYMNEVVKNDDKIREFSESDVMRCLQVHNSSYVNLRYFELQNKPRPDGNNLVLTQRDRQIIQTFAQSLIAVNMKEMARCKIGLMKVYLGDQLVNY